MKMFSVNGRAYFEGHAFPLFGSGKDPFWQEGQEGRKDKKDWKQLDGAVFFLRFLMFLRFLPSFLRCVSTR